MRLLEAIIDANHRAVAGDPNACLPPAEFAYSLELFQGGCSLSSSMSTTEVILDKVSALPPDAQEQVLELVESLSRATVLAAKAGEPYAWLKLADTIPLGWSPRAACQHPSRLRTSDFGFPSDFGFRTSDFHP